MQTMFWVWLTVIIVAIIIEVVTLELVSIWFSFGAIIPLILSAFKGIAIEIQVIVFIVVSGLLIVLLRKYAQKLLLKNSNSKTNLDTLKGKVYRLIKDTDFENSGEIKVNDIIWTAVSEDGSLIKAGQLVKIVEIEGNKLIVCKENQSLNENNTNQNEKSGKDDQLDIEILKQENLYENKSEIMEKENTEQNINKKEEN